MDTKPKILLIFDLDNTILQHTTDYEVIKLIEPTTIDECYHNWAKYMQKVYLKMKENLVHLEQIKKRVESIPLNEGFSEIFEFIRKNKEKFETLIVSGANTLYIKWLIEYHKINDIIDGYFSNFAEPDEEMLIKISPNHVHNCPICTHDLSQCKKKVLEEFFYKLKNIGYKESVYSVYCSILYIGDGSNDFCPSTMLGINDFLFPREDYELHQMVCSEKCKVLRCKVHPWKNGNKILEVIKDNFFNL
jgi:2,3-diketo-5-methylthio-1-phosphopentane phosphatase